MSETCPECDHETRVQYRGEGVLVPCPECGRGRPLSAVEPHPSTGGKWVLFWTFVVSVAWIVLGLILWGAFV